jgi:hypothetical protein
MTDPYPPSNQEHLIAQDKLNMMTAVGYALTKWGGVEDSMARMFAGAVGSDRPYICATVFFSVASIEARLKMLDAAMTARFAADQTPLSKWVTIKNRIGRRKKRRNELAHGQVISYFNQNKYDGTYLIPYYAIMRIASQYTIATIKGKQIQDLLKMETKYSLLDVECVGNAFASLSRQLNILYDELFPNYEPFLIPNVIPKSPSASA